MPPNNAHTSEEEDAKKGVEAVKGPAERGSPRPTDRRPSSSLAFFCVYARSWKKINTAHHVFTGGIDDKYLHPNKDTMHSRRGRGLTMIAEGLVTITKGVGLVFRFSKEKMSGEEREGEGNFGGWW